MACFKKFGLSRFGLFPCRNPVFGGFGGAFFLPRSGSDPKIGGLDARLAGGKRARSLVLAQAKATPGEDKNESHDLARARNDDEETLRVSELLMNLLY